MLPKSLHQERFRKKQKSMIDYIFDALFTLWEVPYKILILVVFIGVFYCAALFIVGIITSIWEAITKKKVNEDIEKKVIIAVTITLIIAAIILDWYQKSH